MRRRWLAAAAVALLGTAPAITLVAPAAAKTTTSVPQCPAQQAPNESVAIVITKLAPAYIRPDQPITVAAELHNCGTTPLSNVRVRVRTGSVLVTRNELTAADTTPPEPVHATGDWTYFAESVPAGATRTVNYETTPAALGLNVIGVYPAQFQVEGDIGAGIDQVGQVRTFLPYFPDGIQKPTSVTWIIPVADRPHRLYDDDQTLYDDALASSMTGNGRLARTLYIAQQAANAHVPFALAVDPDLADTAYEMSQGYKLGSGNAVEGRGKQVATDWLAHLSDLAVGRDVFALPYADADLVALSSQGLTRLLPNPQDGATLLSTRLEDHAVRSDITWPAGGVLTDEALDQLVGGTVRTVVLDPASLAGSRPGLRTESAASPLPSSGGNGVALVSDAQLNRMAAGQLTVPGDTRLNEQRYLAELAMITAEAPAIQRHVLITPPHNWNLNPTLAVAMIKDTVTVPWLAGGSLAGLAATPSAQLVDRGALVYPRNAPRLLPNQVSAIRRCEEVLQQLRSGLDNRGAGVLLTRFPPALVRAASAAWRIPAQAAGTQHLRPIFARLQTTIDRRVRIIPPNPAKYSLAAQQGTLPLTLVNELPVPITVTVRITPQGTAGFSAQERRITLVGGDRRAQVLIPATVTQSGRFTVSAELITPDGKPIGGKPVILEVQSTAYGVVALGITIGAFGLLLLLLLRRVIRQLRSGPATPVPAGSPAERGR